MDNTKTTTHVSLCAGYGGIDLGLSRAIPNLRTIAFSEIEAFACANLVAKMEAGLLDSAPIWTNLKTFPWSEFRDRVDILSGGYPCQPFSAAGKRLGRDDPRHLWPWIADGIVSMRPRICFFENVEGHISLGLREVISELEGLGYKTAWGIFSAREVGAPHQRKRVFILAHLCSEGLQGREWIGKAGEEGQSCGHVTKCGGSTAWPSRPGQPQHAWEPPRVVGNTKIRQDLGRDLGSVDEEERDGGGCDDASDPSSEVVGNAIDNGLHQCSEETRGSIIRSEQRWMQESEGGSASMGDTEGRTRLRRTPRAEGHAPQSDEGMGYATDERSSEWRSREVPESRSKQEPKRSDASPERQAQPALGRDSDGSSNRMDDAELFVTSDNRTDELRLLGNGVVPATATRAFLVLMDQLLNQ